MSTSESRRKPQDLKVEGKIFMGVSSFKYLGNMINNDNINDNCDREIIQAETGPILQISQRILRSKIISRPAKLQVHKTLIRSVATCGAETWNLAVTEQRSLRRF
jgi:hypothetical protein